MKTRARSTYRNLKAAQLAVAKNNGKSAIQWKVFRTPGGYFAGTEEAYKVYKEKCSTLG